MNNTFDLKRFGMLFKRHTIEHGKTYALSVGVLTGVLFLILMFFSLTSKRHLRDDTQIIVFIFTMAAAGSIFGSIIFADLGDRTKAIPSLMLPASHFEKYLVGLIYSYFIFVLVFVGAFYLTDTIVVNISEHELAEDKVINIFDPHGKPAVAYMLFTLFHAFIFWGAIFFKKLHFIKTAIVFFLCLGVAMLINVFILNKMLSTYTQFNVSIPFDRVSIIDINSNNYFIGVVRATEKIEDYGKVIFVICVLLFWTSAYFRLKEKEV